MESLAKKTANFSRNLVWLADYIGYLLFNFYKFKKQPETFKNILVIENLFIGDLIAITPAIKTLKYNYPKAKVSLLTLTPMKEVLQENVNEVISFTQDEFISNEDKVIKTLKEKNFDLAVLLHPGVKIGAHRISKIIKKAEIPFRVGCTRIGFLEGKGSYLHRKTKPNFKKKLKLEDNLDVIKTLNVKIKDKSLELHTTKKAEEKIKEIFKRNKITNKDFIVLLNPSAPHKPSHEWVQERWSELAETLIKKHKAKIILTGLERDFVYNNQIIAMTDGPLLNLAGKLNLKEFFALVKNSKLLISLDGASIHVAAAFNIPVIALFGPSDPEVWRPYSNNGKYIYKNEVCTSCVRPNCSKKENVCMKSINVEDVLDLIKK